MNDTTKIEDMDWREDRAPDGQPSTPHPDGPASPPHPADGTTRLEPVRPTGISWATVLLGISCLVLAAVVLTVQWSELRIDWAVATPAIVVGAGVLLLLAGAAGLVRGRESEELQLD